MSSCAIFVTGGTGYIGRPLIATLLARGHTVRALARAAAMNRVPAGATAVAGDALNGDSFASALRPGDTFVHLIGTPHPNPSKAQEFIRVDLGSVRASVQAAQRAGIAHFIYLSVAQPAPVMQAYVAARAAAEELIREAGFAATLLRPWYVLGPGHRWPILLLPLYGIAACVPSMRAGASRLGLVTLNQMIGALVQAAENPPPNGQVTIVEVPQIRARANSLS